MALNVERVRRVEVWTTWRAAGGTRLVVVTDYETLTAAENLAGDGRLSISVPLASAAIPEMTPGRIIVLEQDETLYDEWKLTGESASSDSGMRSFDAAPIRSTSFATAGIVSQTIADGTILHDFEGVGLTATQHITTYVLPLLAAAGMAWVTIGTINPLVPVDLAYAWDSPLSVLQRLAEATRSELEITRVSGTGYTINLLSSIGGSAPIADIRSEKNLPGLRIDRTAIAQTNRVYPKGASTEDGSGTMARAVWKVGTVAGNVIPLTDSAGGGGPVTFDGQLVGNYLRSPLGTLTAVTASDATNQTVTVVSAAGFAASDLVQFRLNSAGADLTYVDSPADIALYGIISGTVERGDIPAANNILKNPATRTWPGASSSPPTDWTVIGSPTIGKQTTGPYVKTGGNSIKVNSAFPGDGVTTATVPVFPTTENPYGSGYISVYVASGQVRVEMRLVTPAGTLTRPLAPAVASNSLNGQFVELGISGEDLKALGATAVSLAVKQNTTGTAEFYVDSAMFSQTAGQEPFVEGSGGTALWQVANEKLRTSGAPLVSYDASVIDLARLAPATWGDDAKLVLGGEARITEPRLTVAIRTRIVDIERDYVSIGQTRAVLSNKPDDLSGTLARPKRIPRIPTSLDDASLDAIESPTAGGLNNFRVISETTEERTYGWSPGPLVAQAWFGAIDFASPLPADPWSQVKTVTSPLPVGTNTVTVPRPLGEKETLIQVEPRDANGLITGNIRRATLKAAPPQTPVWETAAAESGDTGTLFWKIQERGIAVVAVSVQVKIGLNDQSGFVEPLRAAGGFSFVKQRYMIAGEYEHDVRLDANRISRIQPRATLASGEVVTPEPVYFDRNTTPDIVLAYGEGSVVTVVADSDTKSVRLQHDPAIGGTWEVWNDGPGVRIDVQNATGNGVSGSQSPMGAGAIWPIVVTAYARPRTDPSVLSSPKDVVRVTVLGSTITGTGTGGGGGTPTPIWEYANVAAPAANGSIVVPIALDADIATGYTVKVKESHNDGGGFTADAVITSAMSPVPTTPPLAQTSYTWSGLPATYNRVTNTAGSGALQFEQVMTFEILNSSLVAVATATRSAIWYYGGTPGGGTGGGTGEGGGGGGGGGTLPPPTTGPVPDPILPTPITPLSAWETVTMARPAIGGSNVITLTLDADSSFGFVRLLMRYDDTSGWTQPEDITAAVTPTLTTPPSAATVYTYAGLPEQYAKSSSFLVDTVLAPIVVEVTAEIVADGVVVSSLTVSTSWLYQTEA